MKSDLLYIRELDEEMLRCTATVRHESAGYSFPAHWHNYFELEVLLSGSGRHHYNGHEYEICTGDAWLMSLYDFHAVTFTDDVCLVHICFQRGFLRPELEAYVATRGLRCRFEERELKEICALCELLVDETERHDRLYEFAQKALLDRLTVLLLRQAREESATTLSPIIGSSLAYIHEHFREALSMEQMARMQGFSPNYFGNLFRAAVGLSFRDYLNKIRLKYACGLLVSSELGIKEIAFASGYQSVEYFLYVFKKNLSTSPGVYRKSATSYRIE
ncbi:MAG: helix-turn-helix domain-containing protein [Clostridia bacterium]|nr:helix-turn-helix domain-containing protein [Clostridia bacterium]